MPELAPVLAGLVAEAGDLDAIVSGFAEAGWATVTPAPAWTIAHHIAHLAWTDDIALLVATDHASFRAEVGSLVGHLGDAVDRLARERAEQPPTSPLVGWREGRAALADALTSIPDGTRLPWFGCSPAATSTSVVSTARPPVLIVGRTEDAVQPRPAEVLLTRPR